jgi:hypothetical protein
VGLLERTRHSRMAFTEALKEYFSDARPARAKRA